MLINLGIVLVGFVINRVNSFPGGDTQTLLTRDGDRDWWKTAVFYQIYPRSFKDDNNDGIGDLKGITSKLDHLVDAGITALWLSPIYKSPQVDHGYDISDYRDVDPIFGTLDDFRELVDLAKQKGLKVVLDFVPNHSSDQHEWFKKSVNRESGYENYYVWKDGESTTPPNNWISNFHGPAWTYNEVRQQWYLHQFASGQPDLNYRDPKLVQEMKDVLTFWLDFGVDGFRVDIITALFEDIRFPDEPLSHDPTMKPNDHDYLNHIYTHDQPETYDMVYQWRILLDEYQLNHGGDTRVMMTESYSSKDIVFGYYGNDTHDGAHFTFNFWFITEMNKNSDARDFKFTIDKWFTYMPYKYTANWVLGNHDQPRVASRYGSERVDGLTMLAMLLPGVAVSYNGEEIGMENGAVTWEEAEDPQACNGDKEDFEKNSRDFQRTPFQWDTTVNAGFNIGNTTWLPVSENYLTLNLAAQKVNDLKSHFRIYQEIVKARKSDTLKYGEMETLALTSNVLGLARKLDNNPTYVLLVNMGSKTETVNLKYFENVPEKLIVKIPSLQSKRNVGDVISTKVELTPYEALILVS